MTRVLTLIALCAGADPAVGTWTAGLADESVTDLPPAVASIAGSLRRAIQDLAVTFGEQYPNGSAYLARLAEIERRATTADDKQLDQIRQELLALQREALVGNPLVSGRPILFVVRPQYWGNHGPINTTFENGEVQAGGFRGGGAMKWLRFGPNGEVAEVRTLVELAEGIARDPEVSFDGRRVAFAMRRNAADDYHIHELNADGTNLRQLTFGDKVSDVEPMYLPDGRIVFNSIRDLKYCQCNRHPMGNLFAMDADGANMHQIGGNDLWEGHASLMPDGRILYSRWEYVDRQFGPSFGLWTCNPDGTSHSLFYGNNAWTPGSILDGHVIPGTDLVLCVFGACHDLPWGAMAIVDRRRGMDGSPPVVRIWPAWTRQWLENQRNDEWHVGNIDLFAATRPKYEDPWPLSDKYFLVSRTLTEDTSQSMQTGIFLVDVFGNELLLHTEKPGCYDPMPLAPRPRPPMIAPRTDLAASEGTFYVSDVYVGTGMDQVPHGSIKWLRIIEAPPKRAWTNPGGGGIDADQAPLMNWNTTVNKRIIGDVPVEPDGSAHFTVPANTFLFFQSLDENKMVVQSMRSGTFVQHGERVGCTGCHEYRQGTTRPYRLAAGDESNLKRERGSKGLGSSLTLRVSVDASDGLLPQALSRPASKPEPWYGPSREFNYLTEVQPVFDRHCVGCHDYGKEAGEQLNLAGDLGLLFNTSYLELHRRSAIRWFAAKPGQPKLLIKAVHDGPPAVLPAYAWGSHRSRLIDCIRDGHHDVQLSREEFDRLTTWIDLNAPYYGSYTSAYPNNRYGRSPLDNRQLDRLAQLVGRSVDSFKHDPALQMSFTRPELSPLLTLFRGKDEPKYQEALTLIRAGRDQLARLPREDMIGPNAVPRTEADVERHRRYLIHAGAEASARRAAGGRQ